MPEPKIVGIVEPVVLEGKKKISTLALFDSGARTTSVDIELAAKAQLGPVIGVQTVKNPSIKHSIKRVKVRAKLRIKGRVFDTEVNLQDRSHMKFPILIGRNILTGNFIIDANRNRELFHSGLKGATKTIKSWVKKEG